MTRGSNSAPPTKTSSILVRLPLQLLVSAVVFFAAVYAAHLLYQQLEKSKTKAFDQHAQIVVAALTQVGGEYISAFDWSLLEDLVAQTEKIALVTGVRIDDHLSDRHYGEITAQNLHHAKQYSRPIFKNGREVGRVLLAVDRTQLDQSMRWFRGFLWVCVATVTLVLTALVMAHRLIQNRAYTSAIAGEVEQRRAAENTLKKLSVAVEQSPAAVVITDTDARIEYVNPKFLEVTGYQRGDVIGQHTRILKSGMTPDKVYRELWTKLARGEEWRGEFVNRKKNGDTFWEYASISPIRSDAGEVINYLAVKEDITPRKEYETQLVKQANHDVLTGLANRMLAHEILDLAIKRARRKNKVVSVLFFDLDHFKKVNDTLGHAAGDELLVETARRLQGCMRECDTLARYGDKKDFGTVARLGGDEFTIILQDLERSIDAEVLAERVLRACSVPYLIQGQELFLSASLGISSFPDDADDMCQLMRNADAAMYHAKEEGRGTYRFYRQEINALARERLEMESELRKGVARGELELFFQPMFATEDNRIEGAEALLRWRSPTRGLVSPDKFIPLAEDTGLIGEIGAWALEQACKQAAQWNTVQSDPLYVSVNVSARQFLKSDLVALVKETLGRTSLPPQLLKLEITESVMMQETERNRLVIESITDMGVRFSIDDFGTGYSSLSYLRNFPFESLKIDRTFVNNVTTCEHDAILVKSIVAMAKSLNLKVVAEGIETYEQQVFIKRYGCDTAQGFGLCIPLPASEFLTQLSVFSNVG